MRQLYKILTLILFLACFVSASAQVRTVTFTGRDRTNQYHIPLSKVIVFNLDQLWEEVLYYPDTTLILGTVSVDDHNLTSGIQLMQNVPNPFDGITEFALVLPEDRDVLLEIYDISGRLAVGQHFDDLSAGTHLFQATLTSPQTYLLSAKIDDGQMTIKMVNEGHGAGNTVRHLGMTDANGDFTLYLKNDKYSSGYPFNVGDEMKYIGYAVIDGAMMESNIIQRQQLGNETVYLQFDVTAPSVTTSAANNITSTTASCGGNVTATGDATVTERGVCWSVSHNPTLSNSHTTNGGGIGNFTSSLTGLNSGTTYYVRAYATNGVGTAYGEEKSFTTLSLPTVTTKTVTNITSTTATCGGNVTSSGGTIVTARGVCWSTSQNPTISGSHTSNGTGIGNFTSSITGLAPNTTYYVRAYATNSVGTAYGEQRVFTSTTVPTVTTNTVSNIAGSTATCGGNVTFDGNTNVTARGVCWSTSQNPTVSNIHTSDGTGTGNFTSNITGLTPNTTYYVRAYATNSVGTSYGAQKTFTTSCNVFTVSISGNTVINYGQSTMLTASGASSYQWSTGATTASITVSPTSTTTYTVTGTNNYGCTATASVTVTVNPIAPTVTTNNVTSITTYSASCGGNVISNGGVNVTARGVCWSTSQSPTVNDSHTANGTGTGSFTSSITGLTSNTTYYVRAYATNSTGTGYGEQRSFTTANSSFTCGTSTVSDYDGNTYNTVQIGNQCWMRDNLRTTHYADGTAIPSGGSATSETDPYYYNYSSSGIALSERGYLYNWPAAMHGASSSSANPSGVQGICPMGWHLPSDAEWTQLTDYVSSQSGYVCGGDNTHIAKALASTTGWNSYSGSCYPGDQSVTANNATSFSSVPAGYCYGSSFNYAGGSADFWSATQDANYPDGAFGRYLYYYLAGVGRGYYDKYGGNSVRCLRNETSTAVIDEKSCSAAPTVTDHEGNVYATVQIGNQCWMRDNLRTTTSPSTGTYLIPAANTGYTYTGKQARWYNNFSATYAPMNYGLLYNWNAAVDMFNPLFGETSVNTNNSNAVSVTFSGHRRGICPVGWHLPSDAEWTQLENFVGSQSEYTCDGNNSYIAKALASGMGWNTNTENCAVGNYLGANNATGFSAVPAGAYYGPPFDGAGSDARFWSSTEYSSSNAYYRNLYYVNAYVTSYGNSKSYGYSVRCLRD
jgi:uncharacterized protein (TIGR02145 family)